MNKKIIFVITKSNFGGAQRYVLDLAREFKVKGYDVKVAVGGTGLLYHKLQTENIEVIEIPNMQRDISIKKELLSTIFLYKLFRKEKPNIIHLNSSKAGGLGAFTGRLSGVPKIVFTIHGLAINENRSYLEKVIIKILYGITIKLCHRTIAVSNALRNQIIKKMSFINEKIIVIHNGIGNQDFLTKHEARLKIIESAIQNKNIIDIEAASLIIGTIGELHPVKGQKTLLDGFKIALDTSPLPLYLFIIGDGQEKEKLVKQITDLKLEGNVFLCGHVDNASNILKAFDIFILPSVSEGLPYVVEEAGMAEIPVICTGVGGIPEIITDSENGLIIKKRSPSDIADAILTLVFDPHIRKTLGQNLNKTIIEKFGIKEMVKKTEDIYNDVL